MHSTRGFSAPSRRLAAAAGAVVLPSAALSTVPTAGAQLNVPLTMERPPADGQEHRWACPTPDPAAPR
jgi:hypothetical protein